MIQNWTDFCQEHRAWLSRNSSESAVLYRLPKGITTALARPLLYGRPILSDSDQGAELAFDQLCMTHSAEGVYQDEPVRYCHLQPPKPPPSAEWYEMSGFDKRTIEELNRGIARSTTLQLRNRGYIGRLITDVAFLKTRDTLRADWQRLPEGERPGFPLTRVVKGLPPPGAVGPASKNLCSFRSRFEAFLDGYGLIRMASWELPEPAAPLLDGAPKSPHLLAGRSVQIAVPAHFLFLTTDDLQGEVQELQRQDVSAAGLNVSCVGPRSYERYAQMFQIDHFSRVANSRYGQKPRPRGYVNRLRDALADHLHVSDDHLRKLERDLRAHLAGKLHSAPRTP